MAMIYKDKIFRTPLEQIKKNKDDIEVLQSTLVGTTITPNAAATPSTTLYNLKINDTTYRIPDNSINTVEIADNLEFNSLMLDLMLAGISFNYSVADGVDVHVYPAMVTVSYDGTEDTYNTNVYYPVVTSDGVQWVRVTSGYLHYYK